MWPKLIKQPNIRGIAAGATANGEIPTNGTHYALFLKCLTAAGVPLTRAQILNDIGDIIIRLNGKQKVEADVTFLLDLQKFYGDSDVAGNVDGIIPIFFMRRNFRSFEEQASYAWGMADVRSFTVDVKVKAVAQLSSIEVYSLITNEARSLGKHVTIRRFAQNFGSTGLNEVTSLPKDDKSLEYLALHIEKGLGTFEKVTTKVNGDPIFDEVDPNLNQVVLEQSGRKPQTGYFHIAYDRSNHYMLGKLSMAGVVDLRQQITWKTAAPGNYNIYAEAVEQQA